MEKKSTDPEKKTLFEVLGFISFCLVIFYSVFKFSSRILYKESLSKHIEVASQKDFYSSAYSDLIATHVGLFTALIAVAIAVFGIQKWFDHKEIQKLKETLPQDIEKTVENQKDEIISNLEKTLRGDIDVKMSRNVNNYLRMMLEIHLATLEEEKKEKFCCRTIVFVWNQLVLKGIERGDNILLNYHLVLERLFKELKKEHKNDLLRDVGFKRVLESLNGRLNDIEKKSFVMFCQFKELVKLVRQFVA